MNLLLALDKFKNDLVNLVNNSGLPMAITELVLQEALVQVRQAAMQQLAKAQMEEKMEQANE